MKLSKDEQYEIYEAIESRLFGEKEQPLTKEQMDFINARVDIVDSGKATYVSSEELKKDLDNMIG